jgi:chromosome segregation ATPase
VSPASASVPEKISCPACKSEVSANGATLHKRSQFLADLLETESDVAKLEKIIEQLEGKLSAARAELEKAKSEVQTKPEVKKDGPVERKEEKRSGSGWW